MHSSNNNTLASSDEKHHHPSSSNNGTKILRLQSFFSDFGDIPMNEEGSNNPSGVNNIVPIEGTNLSMRERRQLSFKQGATYSFSFQTPVVDFNRWCLIDLGGGMGEISINRFFGAAIPRMAAFYYNDKGEKEYLFNFSIEHKESLIDLEEPSTLNSSVTPHLAPSHVI